MTKFKLMPQECDPFQSTINVLTFYDLVDGNFDENLDEIKARAFAIFEKNEWLSFTISKEKNDHFLSKTSNVSIHDLFKTELNDRIFKSQPLKSVQTLLTETKNCNLGMVGDIIKNQTQVFKFTVFYNTEKTKICCVKSFNHAIADGSTMFQIWHMFDSKNHIYRLDNHRVENFNQKVQDETSLWPFPITTPAKLWEFITSIPMFVYRSMFYEKLRYSCFQFSRDEISKLKTSYSPSFVSTNDILHTWFCQKVDVDKSFCVVNCRGRVSGVHDEKAGNYLTALWTDRKDLATPVDFRFCLNNAIKRVNETNYFSAWQKLWSSSAIQS